MKARLIAGDFEGARADARWAIEVGAGESESPIGRYAAALARLVLAEDAAAAALVPTFAEAESIPPAVSGSLGALAANDASAYEGAIRALVLDFEAREEFLEDVPVADTVLALQALAVERAISVSLTSSVLPS